MRAVNSLIANMSGEPSEIVIVKALVPAILTTARNAIAAGEEESAGLAYEAGRCRLTLSNPC
jgi:hypothetical protein